MSRDRAGPPFRTTPARAVVAFLSAAFAFAALAAGSARAHERDFTLSRDWRLPVQHEHEIESTTVWDPRPNDLVQELAVEYGITGHSAFEPGLVFAKPNADPFELKEVNAELLFNFRDFGYDKLLPGFTFEYARRVDNDDNALSAHLDDPENALTLKGILSWYTKRGEDVTVNLDVVRAFGDGDHAWLGEFTAGYAHPLDFIPFIEPSAEHPMNVGMEFTQQLSQEKFTGIGPVVSWRANKRFRALATFVYAVNKRSENFDELRLILEWEF
jgi:hypothetical protein